MGVAFGVDFGAVDDVLEGTVRYSNNDGGFSD